MQRDDWPGRGRQLGGHGKKFELEDRRRLFLLGFYSSKIRMRGPHNLYTMIPPKKFHRIRSGRANSCCARLSIPKGMWVDLGAELLKERLFCFGIQFGQVIAIHKNYLLRESAQSRCYKFLVAVLFEYFLWQIKPSRRY